MDEAIWERIVSYLPEPKAWNKVSANAAQRRGTQPYFLTAVHEGVGGEAVRNWAARRIGNYVMRVFGRRPSAADEPRSHVVVRKMLQGLSVPACPHLIIVLGSGAWGAEIEEVGALLKDKMPSATVVGGGSSGIACATLKGVVELEPGTAGLAFALIRCSERPEIETYVMRRRELHNSAGFATDTILNKPEALLVLAQDPQSAHDAVTYCRAKSQAWGGVPVVGGILGGDILVIDNDPVEQFAAGAVVVAIGGSSVKAKAATSRGGKVVGPHVYDVADACMTQLRICPGHSIEIRTVRGVRPIAERCDATEPFRHTSPGALAAPAATLRGVADFEGRLQNPFFLGVKPKDDNLDSGYALLQPQSIDQDGGLAVEGDVDVGSLAAWHVLSPKTSRAELRAAAAAANAHLCNSTDLRSTPPVLGALLFTCSGRGKSFHKIPNADSSAIRHALPNIPLIGCFANGEIGTPPFNERAGQSASADIDLTGFTAQSLLLRIDANQV